MKKRYAGKIAAMMMTAIMAFSPIAESVYAAEAQEAPENEAVEMINEDNTQNIETGAAEETAQTNEENKVDADETAEAEEQKVIELGAPSMSIVKTEATAVTITKPEAAAGATGYEVEIYREGALISNSNFGIDEDAEITGLEEETGYEYRARYTGTNVEGEWSENEAFATARFEVEVTVAKPANYYTGKEIKPSITVTIGGKKVSTTKYTATYPKASAVGAYKGTVTFKGEYAKYDAQTFEFYIAPSATTFTQTKATANSATFSCVKNHCGSTKYIVEYSTDNFNTTKTVSFSSNRTEMAITGLAKGKSYQVKIYPAITKTYQGKSQTLKGKAYSTTMMTVGSKPSVKATNATTKNIIDGVSGNKTQNISFGFLLDKNSTVEYLNELRATYPQYMFAYGTADAYTVKKTGHASGAAYKFSSLATGSKKCKEYTDKINYIVRAAKKKKTTRERIDLVNDYLCANCSYRKSNAWDSTGWGCVVNKKAKCTGYSQAFMSCMNGLGIPCQMKTNKKGSHIWNMVQVGGKWYHVDVTWNDVGSRSSDKYLLKTSHPM